MDLRVDRTREAGALLPDEVRGRAWRTFLAAHAAVIDQIERGLAAEEELPLGHYDVLLALDGAPGRRLRMSELARNVVLSRSGLTRLVDRLEAAGLLQRERCDDDRRGCYAVLTETGHEALRRARPVYLRGVAEHFGRHLDDEEVRVLDESLGRILAAARE
jgi:DNA-binding MarR family transcriptional regulator